MKWYNNTKYAIEYTTLSAFIKNATRRKDLTRREIVNRVKVFPCFRDRSKIFINNRFTYLREKGVCVEYSSKKIKGSLKKTYLHIDNVNL